MSGVIPSDPEITHLRAVDDEYRVTLKVLAVLAERLLKQTRSDRIVIDQAALTHSPDLIASRDESSHSIVLSVSR